MKINYAGEVSNILKKYQFNIGLIDIIEMWDLPHRHFHTIENHLNDIIFLIVADYGEKKFDEKTYEQLILTAVFHDIIYDPKRSDNEMESANFMIKYTTKDDKELRDVFNAIVDTKNHEANSKLSELFISYDLDCLQNGFAELLKNEQLIFKEFQFYNWKEYKKGRIDFLNNMITNRQKYSFSDYTVQDLKYLTTNIEGRYPNIGVYAGSFNPFTIGHLNILHKAEKIFDKVIIAKGKNDSKQINIDEFNKEFDNLKNTLPYKEVVTYDGLLTDFLKKEEGKITLIRGLRNGYDLEAENSLITFMKDMYPQINVIYIPCDKEYEHISSSAIRSIRKYGEDLIKRYVP